MVSISFLVPTAGRPELRNCLTSLDSQIGSDDECLVIGDTHEGPLAATEALVREFGSRYRYIEYDAGRHAWGHPQMNAGMAAARGDWLAFNDDDDVWVPGCVERMRVALDVRPVLFRYLNYYGFLVWTQRELFAEGYIGGHCLVCPNVPSKLGSWTDRYPGDWDFVRDTVENFGGVDNVVWNSEIIAIGRPNAMLLAEIGRVSGRAFA